MITISSKLSLITYALDQSDFLSPFSQKNIQECRCGTESCRGVLGPKPKKPIEEKSIASALIAGTKRFRTCSVLGDLVLKVVKAPPRSAGCSLELQLARRQRMLSLNQSLLGSEPKGRQVSCRARMRPAKTARSNAQILEASINARGQLIRGRHNHLPLYIPDAQPSASKGRFLGLAH
jgi:hypothetical protein